MKRLLPILLLALFSQIAFAQISGYGGTTSGGGISACSTNPPTSGAAGSFCSTSTGLYQCQNSGSACTTAAQWVYIAQFFDTRLGHSFKNFYYSLPFKARVMINLMGFFILLI